MQESNMKKFIVQLTLLIIAKSSKAEDLESANRSAQPRCSDALGMESGAIKDEKILAASTYKNDFETFGAHRARLNEPLSGYRANTENLTAESWLIIKLGEKFVITGIATQGFGNASEWVRNYTLMYSNGEDYVNFKKKNGDAQSFTGNTDSNTIKFNKMSFPAIAQSVMIRPDYWHNNVGLRLEIYGCKAEYYFMIWLNISTGVFSDFKTALLDSSSVEYKNLKVDTLKEVDAILETTPGFLKASLSRFSPERSARYLRVKAELVIWCMNETVHNLTDRFKNHSGPEHGVFDFNHMKIFYLPNSTGVFPSVDIGLHHTLENATEVYTTEKLVLKASIGHFKNLSFPPNRWKRSIRWEYSIISNEDDSFSAFVELSKSRETNITVDIYENTRHVTNYPVNFYLCFSALIDNQILHDFGLLRIVQQPLRALITGPTDAVRGEGDGFISLSAADSFDPESKNNHSMRFNWTCRRNKGSCTDITLDKEAQVQRVNVNEMKPRCSYTFLLTVISGNRMSEVSHELRVRPAFYLSCNSKDCGGKASRARNLIIQTNCNVPRCADIQKYHWIIYKQETRQGKTFWSEQKSSDDGPKHSIKTSELSTINDNTRDPIYKVKAKATMLVRGGVVKEEAELSFQVNSPPYIADDDDMGGCHIVPKRGYAITTKFTIACLGWKDEDKISRVEFRYTTTASSPVIQSGNPTNLTTTLPIGELKKNFTISLHIHVIDSLGDYAYRVVEAQVTIDPSAFSTLHNIVNNKRNKFHDFLKANKTTDAFRLAISVLSLLDKKCAGAARTNSTGSCVTKESAVKLVKNIIDSMVKVKILNLEEVTQLCGIITLATENQERMSQDHQEKVVYKLEEAVDLATSHFVNSSMGNIRTVSEGLLRSLGIMANISSHDADVTHPNTVSVQKKGKYITMKALESLQKLRDSIDLTNTEGELFNISSKYVDIIVFRALMGRSPEMDFVFPNFRLDENGIDPSGVVSKIIIFKKNPYTWHSSAALIKSQVLDVIVKSANKSIDQFAKRSVDLFLPQGLTGNFSGGYTAKQYFVKPSRHLLDTDNIQYHEITVPLGQAAAFARIKPQGRHKLRVYIGSVNMAIIPKNLSFCANDMTENVDCKLDPFTVQIPIDNRRSAYRIGVQYLKEESTADTAGDDAGSVTKKERHRMRRDCGSLPHLEKKLCIKVKSPPTRPPIIIIPEYNSNVDVNYTFYVSMGSCMYWSGDLDGWTNSGCTISPTYITGHIHCRCSHLSTFGGDFFVQPNKLNFRKVFHNFKSIQETGNYVVLSTVCGVLVLYFIGIFLTRRADINDKLKVIPNVYLMDKTEGNCRYQISVQTGLWRGSGTTANVGIVLYGEDGHTDNIFLSETESDRKYFSRGSVNSFVVSFPENLGYLYKIRIWHDNSGKSPSWYLHDVIITDFESKTKQHFIADRWLALELGSGQLEAEIQASNKRELSRFKNLIVSRISKRLADGHLWISLFTRPPQSSFTRTQRLSCCLSVLFTALVTNAMFCQFGERHTDTIQVGPLKVSWTQIKIGVQSALIALPVNVVIVSIFRNTRPREAADYDVPSAGSRGLPRGFLFLAWALCFFAVTASATFTVFYSLEWGTEISNEWLTSIMVSFIQDVIVSQPMLVIVLACLLSVLLRKPLKHDRVRGLTHRHAVDDEKTVLMPDKEALERQRKLRRNLLNVFRTSVRILAYIIFVVLLFVVCYGNRSAERYTMTKSLQDTFESFNEVNTTPQFWNWSKNILVPGLYNATWYNNRMFQYKEGFISTRSGFLVGMPRLRQIRLKTGANCTRGGLITVENCLSSYSEQTVETEQYNLPGWTPITNRTKLQREFELDSLCPKPWRYQTAGLLESQPFRGTFFNYDGGGFAADLGYNSMTALDTIQTLENNYWIDEKTVAIFVEFTIFEPSSALFSAVKYLLETGPTGGPYKLPRVDTLVLYYPTNVVFRVFYQVCQLLLMFVICCFFVSEMSKLYRRRWTYFREFWNWLELILMISALSAMVLFLFKAKYTSKFVKRVHENPFQTSSTDFIVWWSYMELFLLSFVVFLVTVKFLRLLKFNNHICHLLKTLQSSGKDLVSFSVVFMAVLMAYVQVGTLLFGRSTHNYSSISKSLRILVERLLGKNMYSNEFHNQEYRIVGPLFVFTYSVTIAFILFNMFLGILNSSYLAVRKKHRRHFSAVELAEFAQNYFKSQLKRYHENMAEFFKNLRKRSETKNNPAKDFPSKLQLEDEESQHLLAGSASLDDLIIGMAAFDDNDDIVYLDESLGNVKFSLKEIASDLSDVISVNSSLSSLQMRNHGQSFPHEEDKFGEGSIQSFFSLVAMDTVEGRRDEDDDHIDLCSMDSSI